MTSFYPTGIRQHRRDLLRRRKLITVRRTGAIGDALAATCLVNSLAELDCCVHFQCDPAIHPVLRRHRGLHSLSAPVSRPDVNLDGAYENNPLRRSLHFANIFTESANQQLARHGIHIPRVINFAPRLHSDQAGRTLTMSHLISGQHQKPWVMICPRSNSWVNRTVPEEVWKEAATAMIGTKFWLGNTPAPTGIVDLACRDLGALADYLDCADLLVTVDTGPAHIAIALSTPTIVIGQSSDPALHFSEQRDWFAIYPPLDCLNCQQPTCPIDAAHPPCQNVSPVLIYEAVNNRLSHKFKGGIYGEGCISAIVPVYKPNVEKLNKCLAHALPQVEEIIVVGDLDTPWPIQGVPADPRIRYVRKPTFASGYGGNCNYAARHSKGDFILFLNDDCYLSPDCVAKLKQQMDADDMVAIVTHLLRYPNGLVQYGGKFRNPGDIGFGHIDHNQQVCRYTVPVEQESACGASMLVRRCAFYEADGFSEAYRLYSEDDHISMAIRQQGWKIIFTPHAVGIHDEHTSSSTIPEWKAIVAESARIFAKYWGWYFEKNTNANVLGTFK
jgi:GT2 family glycosyltransferase